MGIAVVDAAVDDAVGFALGGAGADEVSELNLAGIELFGGGIGSGIEVGVLVHPTMISWRGGAGVPARVVYFSP